MASPLARFTRHVMVLGEEEFRDLVLRKRSILSLTLYLGVIGVVMLALTYIEERLRPSLGLFSVGGGQRNRLFEWAQMNGFEELARVVVEVGSWPSSIVIAQAMFLLWFPTLVSLVSCDMIAIDVYRGTLRFLLLRTTRVAYFVAKTLAHLMLYGLLYALSVAVLLVLSAIRDPGFEIGRYLYALSRMSFVMVPYLVFLVASTQFVSCWSSKPMNAVLRLHLLWVLFLGVAFFVPWASPLWPTISLGLIAPVFGYQWLAAAGMVAWTVLFMLSGWLFFRRRAL